MKLVERDRNLKAPRKNMLRVVTRFVFVIPFAAIAIGLYGFRQVRHVPQVPDLKYLQHQRELYEIYKKNNAECVKTVGAYHQMAARMEELEKYSNLFEDSSARADEEMQEVRRAAKQFLSVVKTPLYQEADIKKRVASMMQGYEHMYWEMTIPFHLETDPEGRKWGVNWLVCNPQPQRIEWPYIPDEERLRLIKHVTHEEAEALKKRMLTTEPWVCTNMFSGPQSERYELEKVMGAAAIVPKGLDLRLFNPPPPHVKRLRPIGRPIPPPPLPEKQIGN